MIAEPVGRTRAKLSLKSVGASLALYAIAAYLAGWMYYIAYLDQSGAAWLIDLIPFDALLLRSWPPLALIVLVLLIKWPEPRIGLTRARRRGQFALALAIALVAVAFAFRAYLAMWPQLILAGSSTVLLVVPIAEAVDRLPGLPSIRPVDASELWPLLRLLALTFIAWPLMCGRTVALFEADPHLSSLPQVSTKHNATGLRMLHADASRVYCVRLPSQPTDVLVVNWDEIRTVTGKRPDA